MYTGDVSPNAGTYVCTGGGHATCTHLRNDVEVRDQGTLQDNGDVGGVEQLDGICRVLATILSTLDRQVHAKSLHTHTEREGGGGREREVITNNISSPRTKLTWKYITTAKTKTVAIKFIRFGRFCL